MSEVKIPFLNKLKIKPSKILKYPEFSKPFNIKINKSICAALLQQPDDIINPTMKNEFIKVYNQIKPDGTLTINHYQSFGVGRFYSTNNISLVPHTKKIKHTVLKYMGWLDKIIFE
jgi:hypothetical protein